jgi:hypothetical protein
VSPIAEMDIEEVRKRVAACATDLEACRDVYLEYLMGFQDYFNENLEGENASVPDVLQGRRALVQLYLDYVDHEKRFKQFKKCSKIIEDAMKDPIVCHHCPELYIAFGDYYGKEREKPVSANKVYIKGICAGLAPDDADTMWLRLLSSMQRDPENTATKLTIKGIYERVYETIRAESPSDIVSPPSAQLLAGDGITVQNEAKESEPDGAPVVAPPSLSLDDFLTSADVAEMPQAVKKEAVLPGVNTVVSLSAEQLMKTHWQRPPMIFSAPDRVRRAVVTR